MSEIKKRLQAAQKDLENKKKAYRDAEDGLRKLNYQLETIEFADLLRERKFQWPTLVGWLESHNFKPDFDLFAAGDSSLIWVDPKGRAKLHLSSNQWLLTLHRLGATDEDLWNILDGLKAFKDLQPVPLPT